ncbi:MAG TPA: malto-oligosyltrehalose trehalohydrolase [Vicinamibacterales bacterium]|jgi:maltooligosyltrehalose trehalohydrolase
MIGANRQRRLSAGVELQGSVAHARVWAPACRSVDLVLERPGSDLVVRLERDADGFFSGAIDNVRAGDRYRYRLDGERLRPDPVSRFQPDGPHGASEIVDPTTFPWSDANWPGARDTGQVIYELHVGTFTREGTWAAAAEHFADLVDVGITTIEMMPVADFAGRWGWGYDGVNVYAPTRLYGSPDDLRRFVDRAHVLGLAVILDVVYNHLGPDGNYLADFSPDYVTKRYSNDWGQSLNFEGPRPARDFFAENGAYWIDEFHFDGLRLDATQDVHDASTEHVLAEIVRRARTAARGRRIYVVAENEPQHTRLVREPARGGYGMDALFNDDYHHTAIVALTGRREGYYSNYTGTPQEFVSCARFGFLFQGQWYSWQKQPRGTATYDLAADRFVHFLENHDQVANTGFGKRLHQLTSPGKYRALTALTLLAPATPFLFQGQEFAASSPFLFFADHNDDLREGVRKGRREFLEQFPSARDAAARGELAVPDDPDTFHRCRLDWGERATHAPDLALHRDLLTIRREDPVIRSAPRRRIDGAVLGASAFLLRFNAGHEDDRLLVLNLGADLEISLMPEPLLAAPPGSRWAVQWSSDALAYGGPGETSLVLHPTWRLSAESAVLLRAIPDNQPRA